MVTCAVGQRDAELDGGGVGVVDDLGDTEVTHDALVNTRPTNAMSLGKVSPAAAAVRLT